MKTLQNYDTPRVPTNYAYMFYNIFSKYYTKKIILHSFYNTLIINILLFHNTFTTQHTPHTLSVKLRSTMRKAGNSQ